MWDLLMFAKLCTKSISALGWDNEKVISADADHVRMSMFPNSILRQPNEHSFMRGQPNCLPSSATV